MIRVLTTARWALSFPVTFWLRSNKMWQIDKIVPVCLRSRRWATRCHKNPPLQRRAGQDRWDRRTCYERSRLVVWRRRAKSQLWKIHIFSRLLPLVKDCNYQWKQQIVWMCLIETILLNIRKVCPKQCQVMDGTPWVATTTKNDPWRHYRISTWRIRRKTQRGASGVSFPRGIRLIIY